MLSRVGGRETLKVVLRRWLPLVLALFSTLLTCAEAQARTSSGAAVHTRYFSFDDRRYLSWYQQQSGAALLPEGVGEAPVPVIVLLHGVNPARDLHLWLGGGGRDLRELATSLMQRSEVGPFVFAAPSQTRSAGSARSLWSDFDLDAFIGALTTVTDGVVRIDHDRVVLMGHSGAGCSPTGGLASDFWSHGATLPRAIVSIDPCLDVEMGAAMARRPSDVPLLLWWQSTVWPRSPLGFWNALTLNQPEGRLDRMLALDVAGANPHDAIVPAAFALAVRELLAPKAATPD